MQWTVAYIVYSHLSYMQISPLDLSKDGKYAVQWII